MLPSRCALVVEAARRVRRAAGDHISNPYSLGVRERVNWVIAVPTTLVGVGLATWGLALGDFTSSAFSSLLINAGTAVALIAVLVIVQRRVVRQVVEAAEQAAVQVAQRATAELRDRVVRLEDLDDEQAAQRDRRREAREQSVNRLHTDALTPAAVGELLVAAHEEKLLDGAHFRVRTADDPEGHVLYMVPLRAANGVGIMWLDFEPFEFDERSAYDEGLGIQLPVKGDSTVMWIKDESAAAVASGLEAGLERRNQPRNNFSFAFALERLAESVRVMRTARSAAADSPARLRGSLQLLINDEWAITSFGLESLHTGAAFEVRWAGWRGQGGAVLMRTSVHVGDRPPEESEEPWAEALQWIETREGWEVLKPGEQQVHRFFPGVQSGGVK